MQVILIGAGGHAKTVIATIEAVGEFEIYGILDEDHGKHGEDHYGVPILGGLERIEEGTLRDVGRALVAIGDNHHRGRVTERLMESRYELITLVHPSVVRLRGSMVEEGSVVLPQTFIGADATVGRGALISVGVVVGHDVRVEAYGQICPSVALNGGVVVGAYTFIGAGSVVLPNVQVGDHVIVGANSLVKEDLPSGVTAVGSPARIIKRRDHA